MCSLTVLDWKGNSYVSVSIVGELDDGQLGTNYHYQWTVGCIGEDIIHQLDYIRYLTSPVLHKFSRYSLFLIIISLIF